jgi:hypothetical protein
MSQPVSLSLFVDGIGAASGKMTCGPFEIDASVT